MTGWCFRNGLRVGKSFVEVLIHVSRARPSFQDFPPVGSDQVPEHEILRSPHGT